MTTPDQTTREASGGYQCPKCGNALGPKDYVRSLSVCPHCGLRFETFLPTSTPSPAPPGEEWGNQWTDAELTAIAELGLWQDLSRHQVLRQALRLYQLHIERTKAGETCVWSGDAQRAREFAGSPSEPATAAEAGIDLPNGPGVWFHGDTVWFLPTDSNGRIWRIGETCGVCYFYDSDGIADLPKGGWLKASPATDALRAECEELRLNLTRACTDWAETDTAVRDLCLQVLTPEQVNGDNYCVPAVADLVEILVGTIATLKATLAERDSEINTLRFHLHSWKLKRDSLSSDCSSLGIGPGSEDAAKWGEELSKRCEQLRNFCAGYFAALRGSWPVKWANHQPESIASLSEKNATANTTIAQLQQRLADAEAELATLRTAINSAHRLCLEQFVNCQDENAAIVLQTIEAIVCEASGIESTSPPGATP